MGFLIKSEPWVFVPASYKHDSHECSYLFLCLYFLCLYLFSVYVLDSQTLMCLLIMIVFDDEVIHY